MIKLFRRGRGSVDFVTVVSGLPRSGTSMMMRMLEAGGLAPLTDGERQADTDNLRGYYELERVKQLPRGDYGWLEEARGRAVKVISTLLMHLPSTYPYRVIFMRRSMGEILASQRKMLEHRQEDPDRLSEAQLAAMYEKVLADADRWMRERQNVEHLYADFNEIVRDPARLVDEVRAFLGLPLDREKMLQVVEPALYRQRKS
jgi:hypothetical protein